MNLRRLMARVLLGVLWVCVWVVVFVLSGAATVVAYSYATAQRLAPGETPSGRFYVAFLPGADGAEFDTADLRELSKHKAMFLLPRDQDTYRWQGARPGYEHYQVVERTDTSQLVELHRHTSDYDFFSRYRATHDAVVPLYSRVMGPGTGIIALPIAVVLTYFIVRLLRRLVRWRPRAAGAGGGHD